MTIFYIVDANGKQQWEANAEDESEVQPPPGGLALDSPPPSGKHLWGGSGWILDPEYSELAEAKVIRWEFVKTARTRHIDSGLTTPYGDFQTAPPERQNITDAVLLAQTLASQSQPVSIDWTLADNSVVTLGLTEIVTVGLLLGQKVQEAHAHARTLRAAIDAATTVEEVEAVSWSI